MKIVYNWLKDFVEVTATPDELASRLALSGTKQAHTARSLTPKFLPIGPIASGTTASPGKSALSTSFR